MIRERLMREAEGNVAIRVTDTGEANTFEVSGRGELQLAVLVETMRREGYELAIGRPRVVYKEDETTGERLEPIEEVVIDVDAEYAGVVVEKLGGRRGEMVEMRPTGAGKQRLRFYAPTRALIGYHNEFMTDTRGTGVLYRIFHEYAPYKGAIEGRRGGSLISMATGASVAYALWYLQERGPLFIGPGEKIYSGMVVGEHSRGNDLEVNPLKTKQLTNIRTTSKDEAVVLTPPIQMTLEKAIAYVAEDELVEITPQSIRLRKRHLDSNERKRQSRKVEAA
jgi:GTP-binding protein